MLSDRSSPPAFHSTINLWFVSSWKNQTPSPAPLVFKSSQNTASNASEAADRESDSCGTRPSKEADSRTRPSRFEAYCQGIVGFAIEHELEWQFNDIELVCPVGSCSPGSALACVRRVPVEDVCSRTCSSIRIRYRRCHMLRSRKDQTEGSVTVATPTGNKKPTESTKPPGVVRTNKRLAILPG